ncbi:hypothetical protein C8Q75DRAFT_810933 [Abortiporus biennis]|nr:hypothetical protein C8Q75DRAFT_810933 [Abortiporus biennis]
MASESQPNTTSSQEIPIDPIWTSSRTARQIYALGEVEKDISRLLQLAASSISLLTLPQTDGVDDGLPQGGERSEQFVLEVSEYFETLDAIHIAIRSSLAHIRQSRIAPSAINALPIGFVPPSLGVGLPTHGPSSSSSSTNTAVTNIPPPPPPSLGGATSTSTSTAAAVTEKGDRGLQEEKVERDAWKGILDALTRLKEVKEQEGF